VTGPTVLVLVLVSTLAAFGGIYPWALPGILIGALLLTAVAGPWARDPSTAPDVRALDRAIVVIVAAIAIQLLPLPLSICAALSPHLAAIEATIRPDAVVQDTPFQPLSLDPSGTWQALLLVVATALTYRAARIIFATGGSRVLCRALSAFGALAALGAVVQRAVSPDPDLRLLETHRCRGASVRSGGQPQPLRRVAGHGQHGFCGLSAGATARA